MKKIYILGGGTYFHVRNHLSISVPAFGKTAKAIKALMDSAITVGGLSGEYETHLVLTQMADSNSKLVTNDDVAKFIDQLVLDPSTAGIVFNVALVDFEGEIDGVKSGKYAERLQSRAGEVTMKLTPAEKIVGRIRKTRKDIFAVGFKTTCNADDVTQYSRGLKLLKDNSLNLVLANDTGTRQNVIIAPEESRYCVTKDRNEVLVFLVKMFIARMQCSFTRSTVVDGDAVPWNSPLIPENLRVVVNHCIDAGAYKPFQGKTVGHFAVKSDDSTILTSIRKSNFNNLDKTGLVKIESSGPDSVVAHGFKPSVGGQSQRIIFKEHQGLDCIVHFHCPVKDNAPDLIPHRSQWQNECGSHECGQNTSDGLQQFNLGDGQRVKAVFLNDHGPNIVFSRSTDPQKVIDFIDRNFDLGAKTGDLIPSAD